MNDVEFARIMRALGRYLAKEKKFTVNPKRKEEFEKAIEFACTLFPDSHIYTKDDPIQMGAMILCVEDYNIDVVGVREMKLFHEMTALADNFEFYALPNGNVKFAAVFQNVLKRI